MNFTKSFQRTAVHRSVRSRSFKACVAALVLPFTLAAVSFTVEAQSLSAAASKSQSKGEVTWDRRDFNGMWLLINFDGHYIENLETSPSASDSDESIADLSEDWGFDTLPKLKGDYLRANQRGNASVTCKQSGLPALLAAPYATEILQTATQLNWFQEFPGETWRIYLDGRPHPNSDEYPATLHGHSTGKWDEDTLVIDTVNIRTDTLLYGQGRADGRGHSEKMHAAHRIRRIDRDHLQVKGTVEDPEALVSPWHYTLTYHRHPSEEIVEYLCDDNNYDFVDPRTGQETTAIPPRRNLPKPAPK